MWKTKKGEQYSLPFKKIRSWEITMGAGTLNLGKKIKLYEMVVGKNIKL